MRFHFSIRSIGCFLICGFKQDLHEEPWVYKSQQQQPFTSLTPVEDWHDPELRAQSRRKRRQYYHRDKTIDYTVVASNSEVSSMAPMDFLAVPSGINRSGAVRPQNSRTPQQPLPPDVRDFLSAGRRAHRQETAHQTNVSNESGSARRPSVPGNTTIPSGVTPAPERRPSLPTETTTATSSRGTTPVPADEDRSTKRPTPIDTQSSRSQLQVKSPPPSSSKLTPFTSNLDRLRQLNKPLPSVPEPPNRDELLRLLKAIDEGLNSVHYTIGGTASLAVWGHPASVQRVSIFCAEDDREVVLSWARTAGWTVAPTSSLPEPPHTPCPDGTTFKSKEGDSRALHLTVPVPPSGALRKVVIRFVSSATFARLFANSVIPGMIKPAYKGAFGETMQTNAKTLMLSQLLDEFAKQYVERVEKEAVGMKKLGKGKTRPDPTDLAQADETTFTTMAAEWIVWILGRITDQGLGVDGELRALRAMMKMRELPAAPAPAPPGLSVQGGGGDGEGEDEGRDAKRDGISNWSSFGFGMRSPLVNVTTRRFFPRFTKLYPDSVALFALCGLASPRLTATAEEGLAEAEAEAEAAAQAAQDAQTARDAQAAQVVKTNDASGEYILLPTVYTPVPASTPTPARLRTGPRPNNKEEVSFASASHRRSFYELREALDSIPEDGGKDNGAYTPFHYGAEPAVGAPSSSAAPVPARASTPFLVAPTNDDELPRHSQYDARDWRNRDSGIELVDPDRMSMATDVRDGNNGGVISIGYIPEEDEGEQQEARRAEEWRQQDPLRLSPYPVYPLNIKKNLTRGIEYPEWI